jgi:Ca2+-binding RTX toxin-like protein
MGMHPVSSRLLTAALAVAAVATGAPAAHAAVPANSTEVKVAGSILYVTSSGPVTNEIHVGRVNGELYVDDWTAPIFPNGGGCHATTTTSVLCPATGVMRVVIDAGAGDDFVSGDWTLHNELHGGDGDDRLRGGGSIDTLDGGMGEDTLDGDLGIDLADYRSRGLGVLVTLDGIQNDGYPGEHDRIESSVEGVIGGSGDDTLSGSWRGDRLQGGPGDDSLWGAGGGDVLNGGPGDDDVNGGDGSDTFETDAVPDGADTFHGDAGIGDHLTYATRTAPVSVFLAGGAGNGATGEGDTVGPDVENVTGGAGADTLVGSPEANQITGGPGNDRISGRLGDDHVWGGDGDDVIWGSAGIDRLYGGNGADRCDADPADAVVSSCP